MSCDPLYNETHRPQFHFSPKKNWMNDPNGLVYYKGEYHLFFQHNATGITWGPNTWGHAVSRDLVHWQQLEHAIEPDEMGWIWSGSAVVDWDNTGGFQTGDENVLVAFYTTGDIIVKPEKACVQCIAYSNDRGKTWTKYEGNPVVGHIKGNNRDPKVIWHEPSERWVMALYLDGSDYALLASSDLKDWNYLGEVTLPGVSECPDLFELPVDEDPAHTKWVFWGANGGYVLGNFDGETFRKESDVLRAELGTNGYAAQTWSDIPESDGRRVQISWMAGGKYPAMPFNQQMSFPVELTLRTFSDGVRLCRKPVGEIETIHGKAHVWEDQVVRPGENFIPNTECRLFDIRAEIEPAEAGAFGFLVRGHDIRYDVAGQCATCLGKEIPLASVDSRVKLQMLVDRTSLELFSDDGSVSASFCFLPEAADHNLEFYAADGPVRIVGLTVYELQSIWERRG